MPTTSRRRVLGTAGALIFGAAGTAAAEDGAPAAVEVENRAAVGGRNIPGAVSTIRTGGYAVAGDGGHGLYRRVTEEPAHPGKVRSRDGAWWELVPGECGMALEALGVVLDGQTDNAAILAAIGAGFAGYAGTFTCGPGTCFTNGTFAVPRHASLVCRGTVFSAEGSTGTFDAAVVLKRGAQPSQLPSLAHGPAKGSSELEFSSDHGLGAGDTILLYDPADSSYSPFRSVYREGEFAKVSEVAGSREVLLDSPLYADHPAASTEVYHCAGLASGRLQRFTAIAPGPGPNGSVNGWRLEWAENVDLEDTASRGSDNASAALFSCNRCQGDGMDEQQWGANPGFGTQYGLVVANCQDCRLQGRFIGERHGITVGGNNSFSIPNRGIRVHDFEARCNRFGIAAADWHGNTEYSSYTRGRCYGGGLNIAGDHNVIDDVEVFGNAGCYGMYGREILGLTHTIRNVRIFTAVSDPSRGAAIDVGGNSSPFIAKTRRGGHMSIENLTLTAPNQEGRAIVIRNRGFVGEWSLSIRGLVAEMPAGTERKGVTQIGTVEGAPPASIEAVGIFIDSPGNKPPLDLGSDDMEVPVRMESLSGTITLHLPADAWSVNEAVELPFRYPKTPDAVCSLVSEPDDGRADPPVIAYFGVVSSDLVRPALQRIGGTGASGATIKREVSWLVSLREF